MTRGVPRAFRVPGRAEANRGGVEGEGTREGGRKREDEGWENKGKVKLPLKPASNIKRVLQFDLHVNSVELPPVARRLLTWWRRSAGKIAALY